eukprot:3230837-Prymnesium_polylepis.1
MVYNNMTCGVSCETDRKDSAHCGQVVGSGVAMVVRTASARPPPRLGLNPHAWPHAGLCAVRLGGLRLGDGAALL